LPKATRSHFVDETGQLVWFQGQKMDSIKLNEIVIFGNALLLMVPHPEIEAMSEQQSLRSAMQPVYPSP
jgi:hypothetical protein